MFNSYQNVTEIHTALSVTSVVVTALTENSVTT